MSDQPLALPEDRTVDVVMAEDQVRRIRDEAMAVVEAADAALETLRALCGPEPGDFASSLRVKMNMGAGYFRACRADIETLWRKFNVAKKKRP